eukprot:2494926-Amphidinium_carterae.1
MPSMPWRLAIRGPSLLFARCFVLELPSPCRACVQKMAILSLARRTCMNDGCRTGRLYLGATERTLMFDM